MADIEIKNLSFSYPLASNAALSDVSLFVAAAAAENPRCFACLKAKLPRTAKKRAKFTFAAK